MKNPLIIYYSASGATRRAARDIAAATGAALFELAPQVPYSESDLDWNNEDGRCFREMNDPASRPALAALPAVEGHDVIFLGFPFWWYGAPHLFHTLLEEVDLTGKVVVPFSTSADWNEGTDLTRAEETLKALCPAGVTWRQGRLLHAADAQAIAAWVEILGL